MKKLLVSAFIFMLLSCAPKLKSNITTTLPLLSGKEVIVVLDIIDDQSIPVSKVGELQATDSGLSENCSYYQNIQSLKKMARASGANLIKITKHKRPDNWSTCHRLWATIYKVENPQAYESQIEWTQDRKLTWDDFKGEPDILNFPNALAVTNSGFSYESARNLFKDGKLYVQSVFSTYQSWVLAKGRNDYVLRHEQIHFDLTEIYTRKLRKAFSDAKINSNKLREAKLIFDKISSELEFKQDQYDAETQSGSKQDIQEKWEAIVVIELAKYDLYKSN
ncbi:hypothetical protein SAMN04515667_2338 [Formosa sp. Hel1_31_208]|uniref:DUF922 domain-containing protein n=1 Tax=Formosa sp. Hel1_31_208 TaxID=1798225 RepID=UPI00087AF463|nr:hypothetical protein [Formosa sp. Hel1_31_208]SDS51112.1 hypothetical protein SAMN04515667_2338 [Formosa sp. Hel1_31_208]